MSRLWCFLNTPSGGRILLIACVLSLILVATWPDLKAWCFRQARYTPAPKPPPIEARLATTETQLASIGPELSAVASSLKNLNAYIGRIEFEMQKRDPLIAIEFGQIKSSIGVLVNKFPHCITFLSEFGDLIWEAAKCTESYLDFRNRYYLSIPAKEPFSKWRPTAGADATTEDIKEGERWAESLEHHIQHARAFFMSRNLPSMDGEDLFKFVTDWKTQRHDYSGERLVSLMQAYVRDLVSTKRAYVTKFTTVESLVETTS